MKLIDADKLQAWLKSMRGNGYWTDVIFDEVVKEVESGTFDPTPPVQPDTEDEMSKEDVEEITAMLKSMKTSFDFIQSHINGMNNTLDMLGEPGQSTAPTTGTEVMINQQANDMAAKIKKSQQMLEKFGVFHFGGGHNR